MVPCAASAQTATGQTALVARWLVTDDAPLAGLSFSPYEDGQGPTFGPPLNDDKVRARLAVIARYTSSIRTFGATAGLERIPQMAKDMGLSVAAGAWIDADRAKNEREVNNLISIGLSGAAQTLIVGSEVLLRGDLSETELLALIRRVKTAVPHLQITYADTYNTLAQHPRVMAAVDVVFANFYPYWEGMNVDDAIAGVNCMHAQIVALAGGRNVVVSEAGWPSSGNPVAPAAIASDANAAKFFSSFVSWAKSQRVGYYYFSAFDEAWKRLEQDGIRPGTNPQEGYWGLWTSAAALKSGRAAALNGVIGHSTLLSGPGKPTIQLSNVPARGSFTDLFGRVQHVSPCQCQVAVYIRVNNLWYTKPFNNAPLTSLALDGTWRADITTGGVDERASDIAAFLVPISYLPPIMYGSLSLPDELQSRSLASVTVNRP